jgi:hypothetical protein
VAKAERAVDEAERSAKRAELEAKILAPERSAAMQARGEAVVSLIVRLRKEVEGIVAALAEDADEVAKARTLGSTVDYADGLQVAAGLARALLDHGGSLRHDDHQLRWLCEFAIGPGKPAIDAAKAAAALVPFVFASLGATAPAYERAELERRASVYARYRNAAGAFREEEERMRIERERSRRAGVAAAEQAMARRPAATRLRPVPAKPRPESSQGRFSPVAEELPDGPFTPSESDGPRVAAE